MHGPLLLFSEPLRWMEFSLAAKPFKSPDALFQHRDNALFAFKALTGSQIISRPKQTNLRQLHFQGTAQFTTLNQHSPTLPLFEFAMQPLSCFAVLIVVPMQKPIGAKSTPSLPVLRPAQPESVCDIFVISGEERSRCAARFEDRPHP
jgi:hypothetical protein